MNDSKDVVLPHMPIEFSAVIDAKLIAASDRQPIVRANPAHHVAVSRYPQATADDVLSAITSARRAADTRIWSSKS
jgi:acyl-CoA reductase-like NAD-dependent aldehyde dehydrogenase